MMAVTPTHRIAPPPGIPVSQTFRSLLLLFTVLLAGTVVADEYESFTVPPYQMDEPVAGKGGWLMRHEEPYPIYTDPMEATVVQTPNVSPQQATALELKTALKKPGVLDPNSRYKLETRFSVSLDPRYENGSGLYFHFAPSAATSPFSFGFDYGEEGREGGFYLEGAEGMRIILPKRQIAEKTLYTFAFDIHMANRSFQLKVTGYDIEGKPFEFESGEVRFRSSWSPGARPLDLYMGNNRPSVLTAWIDYLKITKEP